MDRCRCKEYEEAVKKIKFYTVGTLRPDILEKFDRSGYEVHWSKKVPDYFDMKFTKPKAKKIYKRDEIPEYSMPKELYKIKQMWCPYMTPVKK